MNQLSKIFSIFAVRKSLFSTVDFLQIFRNYTIRRSFSRSFCSAKGGFRRSERATLFLFIVIAIFLLMRKPVKNNCHTANCSTCTATCAHVTSTPTKKQFKAAWQKLVKYHDQPQKVPSEIQQNLMYLSIEIISLHQQSGQSISIETTNAIDWLNQLHKFFNHLSK